MEWIQANWVQIGVVALSLHTFLKALRDALDKTPETDDNAFEKIVTILGKFISYLFGKRA